MWGDQAIKIVINIKYQHLFQIYWILLGKKAWVADTHTNQVWVINITSCRSIIIYSLRPSVLTGGGFQLYLNVMWQSCWYNRRRAIISDIYLLREENCQWSHGISPNAFSSTCMHRMLDTYLIHFSARKCQVEVSANLYGPA